MVESRVNWTYDPTKSKYTRQLMAPIVASSTSYYEVFRKLGLKPTGSANGRIRKIVQVLGLDTSHFLGMGSNRGPDRKGGPKRLSWEQILVLDRNDGRKEKVNVLRRALIESGILEKCESCGLGPEWEDRPLCLQIDHRNGDSLDNRPGNPRFLCPNCHSQTDTFGSGNVREFDKRQPWRKGSQKRKRVWKDGKRVYSRDRGEMADATG